MELITDIIKFILEGVLEVLKEALFKNRNDADKAKEKNDRAILYWLALRSPRSYEELGDIIAGDVGSYILRYRFMISGNRKKGYSITEGARKRIVDEMVDNAVESIKQENIIGLNHYLLCEACGPDYARKAQTKALIEPILKRLQEDSLFVAETLRKMLEQARADTEKGEKSFGYDNSYAIPNLLNLLVYIKENHPDETRRVDALNGLNLSGLNIGQVNFEAVDFKDVNFSESSLNEAKFTEPLVMAKSCVFYPNGQYFITGGHEGDIIFWNRKTCQKEHQRRSAHKGIVWALTCYKQKGDYYLATCGADGQCAIWNIGDVHVVYQLPNPLKTKSTLTCVDWNQETGVIATAGEGGVIYYGFFHGGNVRWNQYDTNSENRFHALKFSQDGRILVAGSNGGRVLIFSVSVEGGTVELQLIFESASTKIGKYDQLIHAIEFVDLNGNRFITGGSGGSLVMWKRSKKTSWEIEWSRTYHSKQDKMKPAHNGELIIGIRIVKEGLFQHLYSAGFDGKIRKWTLRGKEKPYPPSNAEKQTEWGYVGPLIAMSGKKSELLTCGEDNTIRIWDVTTGLLSYVQGRNNSINRLALHMRNDDKFLIAGCADSLLRVCQIKERKSLEPLNRLGGPGDEVDSMAISDDGRVLAVGVRSGDILIFNLKKKTPERLHVHKRAVRSIVFLRNSGETYYLISASNDGQIKKLVFRVSDNKPGNGFEVDDVKRLTQGFPGWLGWMCVYWDKHNDLSNQSKLMPLVNTLLPNDSDLIAYISEGIITIDVICQGEIKETVQTFNMMALNMKGEIQQMEFSPDGQWFIVADADGRLYLWNMWDTAVKNGEWSYVLHFSEKHIASFSVSPDSRLLAFLTGNNSKKVYVLDLTKAVLSQSRFFAQESPEKLRSVLKVLSSQPNAIAEHQKLNAVLFHDERNLAVAGMGGEILFFSVNLEKKEIVLNDNTFRFARQYRNLNLKGAQISKIRKITMEEMDATANT